MARTLTLAATLAVLLTTQVSALNNGVGVEPAMGWSTSLPSPPLASTLTIRADTWNSYGCDISEDIILEAAQKIKDLKLDEYGYQCAPLPLRRMPRLTIRRRQRASRLACEARAEQKSRSTTAGKRPSEDRTGRPSPTPKSVSSSALPPESLLTSASRFPNGIKSIAKKVNDMGLKLGCVFLVRVE